MGYGIDYSKVDLLTYLETLKTCNLTKSRLILRESDGPFEVLSNMGLKTVDDIVFALKTKKKLLSFSELSGIDQKYLEILIREIRSTIPKPEKFSDFKSMDHELVEVLSANGIKNTKDLYSRVFDYKAQDLLMDTLGINEKTLKRLMIYTDLCRVRWVNHTFAEMLYELSYTCLKDLREADPNVLHGQVNDLNRKKDLYKAQIGLNDMILVIDAAKTIPDDMTHR